MTRGLILNDHILNSQDLSDERIIVSTRRNLMLLTTGSSTVNNFLVTRYSFQLSTVPFFQAKQHDFSTV